MVMEWDPEAAAWGLVWGATADPGIMLVIFKPGQGTKILIKFPYTG